MRAVLIKALSARCGPFVAGRLRALPRGCTSSARRRRFLFLGLCAPSFAGVAALPLHRNLLALLVSVGLGLVVWLIRIVSEPQFVAGDLPHA
jgi:hypothetical protein